MSVTSSMGMPLSAGSSCAGSPIKKGIGAVR
jgi:hypothetical protein